MSSSQAAKRRQKCFFVLSITLCIILLLLVQTGLLLTILLGASSPWFFWFVLGGLLASCPLISGLSAFCATSVLNPRQISAQPQQLGCILGVGSCVIALLAFFLLWFFTYASDQTHSSPPYGFLSDPYLPYLCAFLGVNILVCPLISLGAVLGGDFRKRMYAKRNKQQLGLVREKERWIPLDANSR